MKHSLAILAALCCAMALNANSYACHLKVVVNGHVSEQDLVHVVVTNNNNGTYDMSLKNFVLESDGENIPVGNIEVNGVAGIDEYDYTTIIYNEPITITPGDDPQYDYWLGPMLGAVPVDLTARFIDAAANATIDIQLGDMVITVDIFGVAPAEELMEGDVNGDNEVNIGDINAVIKLILGN